MVMKNKSVKYYLNLPWTYSVETGNDLDGNKIFIVSVNELPGIKTDAPTIEQAMGEIKEAMEATFELYNELNKEIPEPINEDKYKGNISYRTTSKRHFLLIKESKKRNVSLNKVIDEIIDSVLTNSKK